MDDFAQRSSGDRADLFRAVATQRGLNATIVEKDFWVCWTLKRIFALEAPPAGLLFKGGTSLAKVFKVIERFSEDINLSFNRADLGFGGISDPGAAGSGKKRRKSLDLLTTACRQVIHDTLLPRLQTAFSAALTKAGGQAWTLDALCSRGISPPLSRPDMLGACAGGGTHVLGEGDDLACLVTCPHP